MASVARYDVLYDGGCGLCTRSVDWLRRLDWRRRLRFVDVNEAWEHLESSYPRLRRDACLDEMYVVGPDGTMTAGFDGFRTIAWLLPACVLLAPLLYVPGVPFLGRRVYRYVAARRTTTCRVPSRASSEKGIVSAR